jgi:hypothetical protein
MNNKIILLLLTLFFGLVLSFGFVSANVCVDNSLTKQKEINVSGNVPFNYSIPLVVFKEISMNVDYSDLRFMDNSKLLELPYWVEYYNSTEAYIWVKVQDNNSFFMCYGNEELISSSNISNAFLYGTDFEGDSLPSGWDCAVNNCTVSDGQLNIYATIGSVSDYKNIMYVNKNYTNTSVKYASYSILSTSLGGVISREQCVFGSCSNVVGVGYYVIRSLNNVYLEILRWDGDGVVGGIVGDGGGSGNYVAYTNETMSLKSVGDTFNASVTLMGDRDILYYAYGNDSVYSEGLNGIFFRQVNQEQHVYWFFIANAIDNDPAYLFGSEEDINYTIGEGDIFVELLNPTALEVITSLPYSLKCRATPINLDNLTNATFYILDYNDTIVYEQTQNISGNEIINISQSFNGLPDGDYTMDVLVCGENLDGVWCNSGDEAPRYFSINTTAMPVVEGVDQNDIVDTLTYTGVGAGVLIESITPSIIKFFIVIIILTAFSLLIYFFINQFLLKRLIGK